MATNDIKRLYMSKTERILTGVCGGIGEYLNIDPTVIRLLFVVLTFTSGGAGLIAYITLAFVMPEK